jgi:hypothetical protein
LLRLSALLAAALASASSSFAFGGRLLNLHHVTCPIDAKFLLCKYLGGYPRRKLNDIVSVLGVVPGLRTPIDIGLTPLALVPRESAHHEGIHKFFCVILTHPTKGSEGRHWGHDA